MGQDLATAARDCLALRQAAALADWVGAGRTLTSSGVLRRDDVPIACRQLGIEAPKRFRSAADVPELHVPWTAAVGCGLVSITAGRAVAGPALADWSVAGSAAVLDRWVQGVAAVLVHTFVDDVAGEHSLEIGRLVLATVAAGPKPGENLSRAIFESIFDAELSLYEAFGHGFGTRAPAEVALDVLSAFGTITRDGDGWRMTPLGRWALPVIGDSGHSPAGTPVPAEAVYQLKITLTRVRPACWRRVRMPASATLATAFTRASKPISYTYDFGDDWVHEISLENTADPDPDMTHPVCIAGRGDAPAEDSASDDAAWTPFDEADINARFARLTFGVRSVDALLHDDIERILVDARGDAEETTAFRTALAKEIGFPVPATLLGHQVTVIAVEEDDTTLDLRARCRSEQATGVISFADLEFRPGTVEAWWHAAYLAYLGRPHPVPTPPSNP